MQWFESLSVWQMIGLGVAALLVVTAIYDRFFSKDNVLANFPVIGHLRYWLITIGPELRQYIVASNYEERPFNRGERDWIYLSARGENKMFSFGTQDQIYAIGYPIIKHSAIPYGDSRYGASIHDDIHEIPCVKILGEFNDREKSWRPTSIVNISAMSFGSLSSRAIEALNRGAKAANCYHNTGEGGISPYHRQGGDLFYQIGTGYFGCRDHSGNFSMDNLVEVVGQCDQVRAIEIKLSQGAKPGKGGMLPGTKVTKEIASIRGIPQGETCISPGKHSAFHDVPSLIRFIEEIGHATKLPVGVKAAVGHIDFWKELAQEMRRTRKGPDFISIDGGEGGTGAAPLTFSDHVALPFKQSFIRVFTSFQAEKIAERVVWQGSGRLGFPDRLIVGFALGLDLVAIAREAMLAIGCIQAQKCHTGHCPTGVATQSKYLQNAIDPILQGQRYARYCQSLRNEVLAVTNAAGHEHPSQFTMEDIEMSSGPAMSSTLKKLMGYDNGRIWTGIPGWSNGHFENKDAA